MSAYKDLLFLHGHIADPRLALELSAAQTVDPDPATAIATATPAGATNPNTNTNTQIAWREPMTLFKSLLYLGGLESIDSRIGEEEEAFGQTYGNRVASERTFGKSADPLGRRVVPITRNASRKTPAPLGAAGGCA
jgi:hypothetical protein